MAWLQCLLSFISNKHVGDHKATVVLNLLQSIILFVFIIILCNIYDNVYDNIYYHIYHIIILWYDNKHILSYYHIILFVFKYQSIILFVFIHLSIHHHDVVFTVWGEPRSWTMSRTTLPPIPTSGCHQVNGRSWGSRTRSYGNSGTLHAKTGRSPWTLLVDKF